MAKCLECFHWKACFNGKDWDATLCEPCEYFVTDVAIVVECRHCKHYDSKTMLCLEESDGRYWFPDDYCSNGRRKSDEV